MKPEKMPKEVWIDSRSEEIEAHGFCGGWTMDPSIPEAVRYLNADVLRKKIQEKLEQRRRPLRGIYELDDAIDPAAYYKARDAVETLKWVLKQMK